MIIQDKFNLIKADSKGNFLCNFGHLDMSLSKGLDPNDYAAKFQGDASTEHLDVDEQVILQKGLDWEPFLDDGKFTDCHPLLDTEKGVAVIPTTVALPIDEKAWYEKSRNAWAVKGQFLPYVKESQKLVNLAKSYSALEVPKSLHFSIEGKIEDISDDRKYVLKAKVFNVVITETPKNNNTNLMLLAKAITSINIEALKPEDLEGAGIKVKESKKNREHLFKMLTSKYPRMKRERAYKYIDSFLRKN